MLKDMDGNRVRLSEIPNSHLMILGQSGMGKTFLLCRKIEGAINDGKSVLIMDFSGSFALHELKKNQLQCMKAVTILNPIKQKFTFNLLEKGIKDNLTNALYKILVKKGYFQKKLIQEAIDKILKSAKEFSIPGLIEMLELLYYEKEDEEKKNIFRLLSKLDNYSEIEKIIIKPCTGTYIKEPAIYVIQISGYGEIQRKFCVEFFAELIWQNIRNGGKMCDVIIFDEFQYMELKPGSALAAMLREGRKYGLAVWLASQFLGNYDKEAVDTLFQVGQKIFFRPTENDERNIADFINPNASGIWRKLLRELEVGEAILKGKYFINDGEKEIETPIVCKIEAEGMTTLEN